MTQRQMALAEAHEKISCILIISTVLHFQTCHGVSAYGYMDQSDSIVNQRRCPTKFAFSMHLALYVKSNRIAVPIMNLELMPPQSVCSTQTCLMKKEEHILKRS
jgi:hypothetical protein